MGLSSVLATACVSREGFDVPPADRVDPGDGAGDVANDLVAADAQDGSPGDGAEAGDATADVGDMRPRVDIVVMGTPPITDGPMQFRGPADPSRAPSIVYPTDGTIVPPNLHGLEVHFHPGTGNDLFEVSFGGAAALVRIYTRCAVVADGCALVLDDPAFTEIVRAARPSTQLTLSIRGTSASASGAFGASASQTLGIADNDVRGGIYYWNAAGSIMRYEFGLPGARAESYLRGDPINCLGCHVLSRNGTRITAGRFIPAPAPTRIYDAATRTATSSEFGANFGSFSPDASRLITSDGNYLTLRDGNTGAGVTGLAGSFVGSHPDWSPDGNRVVFVRPRMIVPFAGNPGNSPPADLYLMSYASGMFAAAVPLVVAATENNYYPSFSPDSNWLIWNRSAGNSYDAVDAHLWAMPIDRSRAPIQLRNADGMGDLNNSWPKFAPFTQTYGGDTLYWFTFSSRRDYGLRLQNSGRARDMQTAQLWMAAFRPNLAGGMEPSSPAFWLPFQDIRSGNHIAQWTQTVRRASCRMDMECGPDERCVILAAGGVCVGR